MITKYRIAKWRECSSEIIKVEIERETDSSVWIRGHRQGKNTESHQYLDTWKEAEFLLREQAEGYLDTCKNRLKDAEEILSEIKELREE